MKGDIKGKNSTLDELKRLRRRIAELELLETKHRKIEKTLRESEEQYRTRVENINLGVYRNTAGPHGRFLQANPAIAKMFGYDSVKEFMKVRVSKLYQDPKERKLFVEETLLRGSVKDKELRLKKKDGTPIVCSCTSKVQFDEDGGIKWIDGVIEDITDQKQSEERIIKSSYFEHTISSVLKVALEPISLDKQLNRILDLIMAIPFLSLQSRGFISLVEGEHGVLTMKAHRGFSDEELCDCSRVPVGKNLCEKAALTCKIAFSGSVEKPQRMGKYPHAQYCVPINSGKRVYGIISLILKEGHKRDKRDEEFLISAANTLAGIIEHKNTEMEKDKLQSQLIQSEKVLALGRMTANVAHEIRNPITVVGGLAKRLGKKMPGGTKEKEYTEIIVSEAHRLERILRSILSLTREDRIYKKNHSINEIIDESLHIMEILYKEKSIHIRRSFTVSEKIPVDKERVREVIDNLISNAAEAIQESGEIRVATGKKKIKGTSYVTVKVTDTGQGITKDDLSNIFEPFFTTKAVGSGRGIGLGLPICKKIMDEHDGFMRVESDVGKGSTFSLFFHMK